MYTYVNTHTNANTCTYIYIYIYIFQVINKSKESKKSQLYVSRGWSAGAHVLTNLAFCFLKISYKKYCVIPLHS